MSEPASSRPYGWATLMKVTVGAFGMLLAIDVGLKLLLGSPPNLSEVADKVDEYAHLDPSVVVIGSSHARSFDSVAAELRRRTAGREVLLEIPLEGGKLTGYNWVVQQRLRPLIDEKRPDGSLVRPGLRQAILVTEWWDSCKLDGPPLNIPGRAWTARDYLEDVQEHGITSFNRSYVSNFWASQLKAIGLVRNRIGSWIPGAIRQKLYPPVRREAYFAGVTVKWQQMVEQGSQCIADPTEMAALDSLIGFFGGRGVTTTVLLYPRKPGTLTEKGKATTLASFGEAMRRATEPFGVRIIDLTTTSPLDDNDFAADFDHVTPEGNKQLAHFLLDGPLAFLDDSKVTVTP